MVWQTLILLVVTVVLTELLRPKPKVEDARAAGLGDFKFPTATEGRPIPIVWGRVMLEGMNVVWFGGLVPIAIEKKIQKNLWSHFYATVGYRYTLGIQGALCRGPIDAVRSFEIGDQQVWTGNAATGNGEVIAVDLPELFGGDNVGNGGVQMDLQVYLGTTTQTANDYLNLYQARKVGAGRVQPTYAGTAYVVARKLGSSGATLSPLIQLYANLNAGWSGGAYVGNSETIKPWRFEVTRYPALMPGQTSGRNKVGEDANPANVIYELLTNTEWGCGLPAADVDTGAGSSFVTAGDTLFTEGNGFSFVLDRELEGGEFLQEVERQIDGVVFLDHLTGKWTIKLVRADYVLASQPLLDESNIVEVKDYTRGTWADTTNQVQVEFDHRANRYKLSNALAQDTANMLMQGGGSFSTLKVVPGKLKFPGVKNPTLAQKIATRELRSRSFPLARATVVVNRSLYTLRVGSVVRFSLAALGVSELAMRVLKIDFGTVTKNAITLSLVQDVFAAVDGVFGTPPDTTWTYPVPTLAAYDPTAQLAFEAPRAVLVRDPEFAGDATLGKIMVAALDLASYITARIDQRNAVGSPSGAYTPSGQLAAFAPVGKLASSLAAGVANPTSSVTITCDPSLQTDILEAFGSSTSLVEMGTELAGLVLIGSEFLLVRSAIASGADVVLQTVYRGALDSAQEAHAAGDLVWFLCAGANLSEGGIPNTNQVQVELRPQTESATFGGTVTPIAFTMAKRTLRPYAPGAVLYNGSGTPFTVPSLEGAGSGIGGFRVDVAWWRRRYDTPNELTELTADNAVDASTEYQLTVRADPNGANTLVGAVSAWTTGAGPLQVSRADILTAAAAGTLLRFSLQARHDVGSETDLTSRANLVHDVTPTSTLAGKFYFGGGLAANVASASYTAAATGTFTLAIGAMQATAAIQVSLNGGAFSTVIAAGLTSGTFAVTGGDTVRVRRTVNEAPQPNYVELRDPGASVVAYGTFKN